LDFWSKPGNWGLLKDHEELPGSKELRNVSLDEAF